MKRHWKLIAVPVGMLVLAGVGIGLAVELSGPSPTTSTAAAAVQLTKPQQVQLEQGIAASTVTAQASVLAVEVRSMFEQQGKPLLPAGSHVSINDATFHAFSGRFATVDASVSGPSPGRWQFVLVRENDRWFLLGTRKLS